MRCRMPSLASPFTPRAGAMIAAFLLVLTGPLGAQDDEASLRHALGERAFQENCLICHGRELTTRQRLSPAQWQAEVTKMIGWGAPVPPDAVTDLTAWLVREFPTGRPVAPAARMEARVLKAALPAAPADLKPDAASGRALFEAHCANCHGREAQGGDLGPNLVERPVLVLDSTWHEAVTVGRRRMPGYAAVLSGEQSAAIRGWLLGLTYPSAR